MVPAAAPDDVGRGAAALLSTFTERGEPESLELSNRFLQGRAKVVTLQTSSFA